MLFDDKTKGIAQSYLSMLGESHFKVGDKVKCKASGMSGTVTKLDEPETGKYYTVKQDSGKVMKYAPDELKKLNEAMDPVNPKAVKKKFDDRKDKDIDNDGDTDSSDEYLHKRRKAISKATKEEVEIEINKKKMKNGEENDEDEDDDDDEAVVVKKKGKDKEDMSEAQDSSKIASSIEAYAKKSGGVDKTDMMKVAGMIKRGDMKGAAKYAKTLDTDPRDYLLDKMGMMEDTDLEEMKSVSDIAQSAEKRAGSVMKPKAVTKRPMSSTKSSLASIGSAAEKRKQNEDVEQVDELSKKTLGSYAKRASADAVTRGIKYGEKMDQSGSNKKELDKMNKREAGVRKAVDRLTKEDYQWNWDAILEAPEEEIDAMIEQMTDNELDSFVAEFESIEEGSQLSTNSIQPMRPDGRETLDPRAPADRAFANAHRQQTDIKDYPGKDKPVNNAKSQAPVRPGEKRNPEAMKTLSDIRNRMK